MRFVPCPTGSRFAGVLTKPVPAQAGWAPPPPVRTRRPLPSQDVFLVQMVPSPDGFPVKIDSYSRWVPSPDVFPVHMVPSPDGFLVQIWASPAHGVH